jgi:hypothetical protein
MAWPNPRALATAACLLLAGLPWLTAQKHDQNPGPASQPASVSAASRQGYVPIEQLRVGDRVLAQNPEHSTGETASDTQVNPGTWRHLVLEADNRWAAAVPHSKPSKLLRSLERSAAQETWRGSITGCGSPDRRPDERLGSWKY